MSVIIYYPNGGSGGGGTEILTAANFSDLPLAADHNGEFYWCLASQGTAWLPGTLGGTFYPKGLYYSDGSSWTNQPIPYQATISEVNTGTNDDKFVTPSTFTNASKWDTKMDDVSEFIFVNTKSDLPTPSGGVTPTYVTLANTTYTVETDGDYEINYVGEATDNNKLIEMNVGSACTYTVNNSVFSAGDQVLVSQYGAGQVTFVAGAGVTSRSASGKLKLTGQYSMATIIFLSASEFYIAGDLTA